MTRLSKTVTGLAAAATLALSAIALSSPAQAHWHGGWGHWGHGYRGGLVFFDGTYDNCRLVNIYDRLGRYRGTVKRCW
jgi:hypothetical protein